MLRLGNVLACVCVVVCGPTAYAQWLYVIEGGTVTGDTQLVRVPLDGTGAAEVIIPDDSGYLPQMNFGGEPTVALDEVGGKVYWTFSPSEGAPIDTVMRANLDGSSPEVFHVVTSPQEYARYIRVVRAAGTAPAVSNVGLAILALLILCAGGVVLARRRVAEPQ